MLLLFVCPPHTCSDFLLFLIRLVFLPIHNTYHIRQIHTKGELNKEMSEKQYVNGGIIYGQEKRI